MSWHDELLMLIVDLALSTFASQIVAGESPFEMVLDIVRRR